MSADMSPAAVSRRLRLVAERSDLRAERRMDTKVDMRPAAVSRRLRTAAQLTRLGLRLGRRPAAPLSARLSALRSLCDALAAAHRDLLAAQRDPPAADRVDATRRDVQTLAGAIVTALREDREALRHVELCYGWILGEQRRRHGVAQTPQAHRTAAPATEPADLDAHRIDEATIRAWLLDVALWRDGALPIETLARGWARG